MNKHKDERLKILDQMEDEFVDELVRNYKVALKEIRGILAEYYEKYDMTWVEMQKYKRLEKLELQLRREINKLTGRNANTLLKRLRHIFREGYYRTAWTLINEVNADIIYPWLDNDLVMEMIKNPLDRVGMLQRNQDVSHVLERQLREQLTQGLILGEAYNRVAKRIKERMDVGATNTIRIARTESHRVRSKALYESMKVGQAAGIELKKVWMATIDSRTRHSHGKADGQAVDIDEPFTVNGEKLMYPGDPAGSARNVINCRCNMEESVSGFRPRYRRVKGVGIVPYKTYDEFLNSLQK